ERFPGGSGDRVARGPAGGRDDAGVPGLFGEGGAVGAGDVDHDGGVGAGLAVLVRALDGVIGPGAAGVEVHEVGGDPRGAVAPVDVGVEVVQVRVRLTVDGDAEIGHHVLPEADAGVGANRPGAGKGEVNVGRRHRGGRRGRLGA